MCACEFSILWTSIVNESINLSTLFLTLLVTILVVVLFTATSFDNFLLKQRQHAGPLKFILIILLYVIRFCVIFVAGKKVDN